MRFGMSVHEGEKAEHKQSGTVFALSCVSYLHEATLFFFRQAPNRTVVPTKAVGPRAETTRIGLVVLRRCVAQLKPLTTARYIACLHGCNRAGQRSESWL